jgi:hypothetical protein
MYLSVDDVPYPTPDWIRAHVATYGGGWFFPVPMSADHPVVLEGARCDTCDDPVLASDIVLPMPGCFGRWEVHHRECVIGTLAFTDAQKRGLRPPDYETATSERRALVDARLRLSDSAR